MNIIDNINSFRSAGAEDVSVDKDIFVKSSDMSKYKKNKPLKCTRCSKGIHNTRVNQKRCRGNGCECLCQAYYEGLDGRLRRHGTPDDSYKSAVPEEPYVRTKTDDLIDAANLLARRKK